MKYLLTFLLIFVNITTYATDDVVILQKGQAAPFEGYLLTKEKGETVYKLGIDLNYQTRRGDLLEQKVSLLDEQNQRNRDYIKDLSTQLVEAKSDTIWSKIGFFVLGCAVTTAVTWGVTRAIK